MTAYAGSWPLVADFPGRQEKDVALALAVVPTLHADGIDRAGPADAMPEITEKTERRSLKPW